MFKSYVFAVLGSLLVVACGDEVGVGSNQQPQNQGGSGGSSGNAGSSGGSGSAGTAGSVAGDLSGTWTIVGSSPHTVSSGSVILSSTTFEVLFPTTAMVLQTTEGPQPSATFQDGNDTAFLVFSRTTGPHFDTGIMPFDLSGVWTATQQGETGVCTGTLGLTAATGSCNGTGRVPAPLEPLEGSISLVKVSDSASKFGSLGGVWKFGAPGKASCLFSFIDSTFSSNCQNTGQMSGAMSLTFSENTASGTTSEGVEFSATRTQ